MAFPGLLQSKGWIYETSERGMISSASASIVRSRRQGLEHMQSASMSKPIGTWLTDNEPKSALMYDNRTDLAAGSANSHTRPLTLSELLQIRGTTRRRIVPQISDAYKSTEASAVTAHLDVGGIMDISSDLKSLTTAKSGTSGGGAGAGASKFITPAPGGPANAKPPSTFGLAVNLVTMWITYFVVVAMNTILACQVPLVLLAVWGFLYITRFYFADILDVTSASYEVVALILNWIIDRLNDVWVLFQPFVDVYNLVIFLILTIIDSIFASISIPMLIDLLKQLAEAALQIVPVLVDILRTLMPVILTIIPALIQVVIKLFVENIQILVDLIQLIARLVLALVPTLVQLIPILASLITNVFESLADVFVSLVAVLLDILATSIPYILQLVNIFVAIITEVGANTTPGMDIFDFIGVFIAASLGFLADIITVFVNLVVELVTNNLPIIVNFIVQIIQELVNLIPPIIVAVLNVVITSFGTIVDLVKALFNAIIDLVPVFIKIFDDLMASGAITDLISALTSMFLVPRSPAMLQNIATALANFVTQNIGMLEQAISTIFEALVTILPMIGILATKIVASGVLNTLLTTIVEVVADFLPILADLLATLLTSLADSGIVETLLKVIMDLFVQLAVPILIVILTKLPFTALVKLLVSIIIAVTKMIPVLIQLLLNMILGPTGFAVIVGLVTAVTGLITFIFTDPSISGLIPTLLEGIINGFLSIFTGPNGVKINLKWLRFIFDLFFGIVARFFYLIAQLATGGEEGSVDDNNILKLIEPVLSFFQVLFSSIAMFGQLLSQVEFLVDAFGWMFSVFDYLLAVADAIGALADALS